MNECADHEVDNRRMERFRRAGFTLVSFTLAVEDGFGAVNNQYSPAAFFRNFKMSSMFILPGL